MCACGAAATTSSDGGVGSSSGGDGYEAFPPDLPSIVDNGGPKLTSPKLVTVTWASDTSAAVMQDFDEKIGASAYWRETTSEYGIGPAHNQNVVLSSAPPATWEDAQIDTWVQTQAQSASSGWPAPDTQTVYVVYLPASVQLTSMGQNACLSYAGYHTDLGTNPDIAYALIPEGCYEGTGYSLVDNATSSAAHEIVESATDPFSNESPAIIGFDSDHLAWEVWTEWQDEVADACEYSNEAYYREGSDLPYLVQRIWSNKSAQEGHDPCGPKAVGPYFDVAPQGLGAVSVQAVGPDGMTVSPYTSKGWRIGVGQTAVVKVGFLSDAATGSWSVTVAEGDCCTKPSGLLSISPTTLTGKNGDSADVSITVSGAPATGTAISLSFLSSSGNVSHIRPALVAVY
jgi:hypothetical protein